MENIDLSPLENKMEEGVSNLSNKIDNIKLPEIDTTELAKQGENQEATNSKILDVVSGINVDDIANAILYRSRIPLEFGGFSFTDSSNHDNITSVYLDISKVNGIRDDNIIDLTPLGMDRFLNNKNITFFEAKNLTHASILGNYRFFKGASNLRTLIVPKLKTIPSYIIEGTAVEYFDCSYAEKFGIEANSNVSIYGSPVLDNLITGYCFNTNILLNLWNPYTVLETEEGVSRINNNIRKNMIANMPDRNGLEPLTITFHKELRNALTEETEQAFAAKNWNISPAKSV